MASVVAIPDANYPVGTWAFGPSTIPAGVKWITGELDRTMWVNPSVIIFFKLEYSPEGSTWIWLSTFTAAGGVLVTPLPNISQGGCILPSPDLSTRQVRGSVQVIGGSLNTSGNISVS